jgi:hypothetical protein
MRMKDAKRNCAGISSGPDLQTSEASGWDT